MSGAYVAQSSVRVSSNSGSDASGGDRSFNVIAGPAKRDEPSPFFPSSAPEASEPLLPETRADLCATYAPLNRQLRDLLAAERTSCEGAACDGFLWPGDCAA